MSGLLRRVAVATARQPVVRKLAVSTPLMRNVAWRFVAGETLPAAIAAAKMLNGRGASATINHVGTHVTTAAAATGAADVVVKTLQGIQSSGVDSTVSIKLTQIGLDVDEGLCRANLARILESAAALGNRVTIDMEESRYVERTLLLFEAIRETYGAERVGIVVQSYLRDRTGDLPRLIAGGSQIRLVKGGYWEPPAIAYGAAEIDAAFLRDIKALLPAGREPAIATHDDAAIAHADRVAATSGIGSEGYEFQLLYGVRPRLLDDLVASGHRVRCYVPWGTQWYEYVLGCLRRSPRAAVPRLRPGRDRGR
jgi:proline dehydrogenase